MQLSDNGRALIKGFEGYSSKAYPDAHGYSIGYGHFIGTDPSLASQTITREEADRLFDSDVRKFETAVSLVTPVAEQHEFDAMVSLAYNVGTGNTTSREGGFAGSTVARLHNAGDRLGAADAFRMWNKSQGKVLPVLVNRREKERAVYLNGYGGSGVYPAPSTPSPSTPSPSTPSPSSPSSPSAPSGGWLATPNAPSWPTLTPSRAGGGVVALLTLALGWAVYRFIQH